MKTLKQLVSFTLSAMMVLSCFAGLSSTGVFAAEDETIGNSAVGASTDKLKISAESNLFPDSVISVSETELNGKDDLVTVSYYINTPKRLVNFDWELDYDPQVLEFAEDYNFNEDYDQMIMPQVSGEICLNTKNPGRILCNYVSVSAKTKLSNNDDYVPFVTVTFKAVGSGDAKVNLSVKDLSICDRNGNYGDYKTIESVVKLGEVNKNLSVPVSCVTAAYAGTYSAYKDVEPLDPVKDANLKFKNYSLSLASNIEMNFNVAQSTLEGYDDPYVVVNINGEETTIEDYTVSGTNYVFKFDKIYPQLVGENVTAVLHAKQGRADHYSAPYTKSVKGYCENMFKYDHNTYGKLHTLLVNLLNYGEAAQNYVNFKTNELCTRNLTSEQKAWALTQADCDELKSVKNYHAEKVADPTVAFKSAGLSIGSTVGIKMYFTSTDIDSTTIVATINGNEYNFTSEDFEPVSGYTDRYCLTFNNLLANDMRKTVYFRGYQNGKLAGDTATYSIESYVSAHINDGNKVADLIKAMYLYGEAAKAFAG